LNFGLSKNIKLRILNLSNNNFKELSAWIFDGLHKNGFLEELDMSFNFIEVWFFFLTKKKKLLTINY